MDSDVAAAGVRPEASRDPVSLRPRVLACRRTARVIRSISAPTAPACGDCQRRRCTARCRNSYLSATTPLRLQSLAEGSLPEIGRPRIAGVFAARRRYRFHGFRAHQQHPKVAPEPRGLGRCEGVTDLVVIEPGGIGCAGETPSEIAPRFLKPPRPRQPLAFGVVRPTGTGRAPRRVSCRDGSSVQVPGDPRRSCMRKATLDRRQPTTDALLSCSRHRRVPPRCQRTFGSPRGTGGASLTSACRLREAAGTLGPCRVFLSPD